MVPVSSAQERKAKVALCQTEATCLEGLVENPGVCQLENHPESQPVEAASEKHLPCSLKGQQLRVITAVKMS